MNSHFNQVVYIDFWLNNFPPFHKSMHNFAVCKLNFENFFLAFSEKEKKNA